MPASARWLIIGGYAALLAGLGLSEVVPPGSDELGIANAMIAFVLGALVCVALLLAGVYKGTRALVRARGRVRWFDYILLAAGVAPFALLAARFAFPT